MVSKRDNTEKRVTTLTDLLVRADDPTAHRARGVEAQLTLRVAYKAVFTGAASREQAELVLVDLAKSSGYYNTTPVDAPDHVLRQYEGQREMFGRIMRFMEPPLSEMIALHRAVAEEQRTDVTTQTEIS